MNKPTSQVATTSSYESGGIYSPPNINSSYTGKAYGGASPRQDTNIYAVKSTPGSRYPYLDSKVLNKAAWLSYIRYVI